MGSLASIYIKAETLKTLIETVTQKGEKGVEITLSISDETNQWDQNLSGFVAQSKEDREAQKKRFYIGNGKVFWTDGKISIAQKAQQGETQTTSTATNDDHEDLPF